MEGPGEVVSPQALHHGLLEELQLVGDAARSAGVPDGGVGGAGRPLGLGVAQRRALEVLIQQGGLADALACAGAAVGVHPGQP